MEAKNIKGQMARFLVPWMILVIAGMGCGHDAGYLKEGQDYFAAGDWDNSVKFFQEALDKNPDDAEVKLMLAESRMNASLAHLSNGEALLKDRRFNEAISEFQISLAFNPGLKKAGQMIERTKNMKSADFYTQKGENDLRTQKYFQAKESFQRALKLDPENEDAQRMLAYFRKKPEPLPKLRLGGDLEKPVSFKFKQTSVINVFEVLSRLSGINFIFDKDMNDSRVTLFMTDVSVERFLEVLLKTNNLSAKLVNKNTLLVYPNTPEKAKEYDDLQIRTFYLANLEAKRAVSLLSKILRSKDIISYEKMNAIIIRGRPETLEIASRIIEANDRPPSEVVLQVEILQVSRNKEKQLGIEYSPTSVTFGIGETAETIDKDTTLARYGSIYALENLTNKELMLSLPTAILHFLKLDGDTKILANPQVRVKNNEKASIHIGERVPLRTNRRIDTNGNVTNDYQYQDVGVKLDASPTINMHGEVSLDLSLEISSLGTNVGTVDDPQYAILSRKAKSVLTLQDGEPVIIGGLISNELQESVQQVPYAGDVPVLGYLFTNQGRIGRETDVLMSITPFVIRSQELPGEDVTQIWSGNEKEFSLEEPYENFFTRRDSLLDNPNADFFQEPRADIDPLTITEPAPVEPSDDNPTVPEEPEDPEKQETDMTSDAENVAPDAVEKAAANVERMSEDMASPAGNADDGAFFWPETIPFSVHVNSYSAEGDALARLQELSALKYDCFMVYAHVAGKGNYYRIFVGKYADFKSANTACEALKSRPEFADDIHAVNREWAFRG